ncbi:hypothetical protein [Arthrobacter celericrescens]|uniref:hypothetical protein n=1 Tax=Arthrobacter celericrescens TaxID=2320851 RepID=UPI000EA0CAE4|nr:hypothetical protein [Arthrobacter celericrescens]
MLALAVTLGIQAGAAHAEETPGPIIDNPVDPGTIIPGTTDPIDLGGTTEPGTGDPATTDPGTTDPAPSGSETSGPVTNLPGTILPDGESGGTVTNPVEPAPNPVPQTPAAPAPAPFIVEQPAVQPLQDPGAGQIVPQPETPAATTSTTPAPKPAVPAKTAAPVPIPEPVAKTLDSVVSVATGSPLHVQIITVLALLGAGFAYFRFMGSKSPRTPVRSHK